MGNINLWSILDFHSEVDENCVLLVYHAVGSGNYLPTFRDNLSAPTSRVKNQKHWKQDDLVYIDKSSNLKQLTIERLSIARIFHKLKDT